MSTTAAHYAPHQHHSLHSMPHYERLPGVDSLLANTADRGNGLSVNSNQNHHYREQPHGKQPFHRHGQSGAPGSAALASPHAQQLQTPPLSAGAELNRSPTMSGYGHSQKQEHHGNYIASAHLPSRMVQHQDSSQPRVREEDQGRTQTSTNPNVSPRQLASRQPPPVRSVHKSRHKLLLSASSSAPLYSTRVWILFGTALNGTPDYSSVGGSGARNDSRSTTSKLLSVPSPVSFSTSSCRCKPPNVANI
jgi:hypothetical protein